MCASCANCHKEKTQVMSQRRTYTRYRLWEQRLKDREIALHERESSLGAVSSAADLPKYIDGPGAFIVLQRDDAHAPEDGTFEVQRCMNCKKLVGQAGEQNTGDKPYRAQGNRRFKVRFTHKTTYCTHPQSINMVKTRCHARRVRLWPQDVAST